MRAREAIDELRRCPGLPRDLRLDSYCDQRIDRVVLGLMQSDAQELEKLRDHAAAAEHAVLLEWSDRAASRAVRARDSDLLIAAVFAFGFAESAGAADWVHLQSQLRAAARIIGRDADEAWAAAIANSDDIGAAWLDQNRGRRRFMRRAPAATHFSDPYDGGRFRFGRPPPASDRVPLTTGLPGGEARPDLSSLTSLHPTPVLRDALEDLVTDLWRRDDSEDADRLLHAVLAHDDATQAVNELYAVVADMPAAADSLLAAVLARA